MPLTALCITIHRTGNKLKGYEVPLKPKPLFRDKHKRRKGEAELICCIITQMELDSRFSSLSIHGHCSSDFSFGSSACPSLAIWILKLLNWLQVRFFHIYSLFLLPSYSSRQVILSFQQSIKMDGQTLTCCPLSSFIGCKNQTILCRERFSCRHIY